VRSVVLRRGVVESAVLCAVSGRVGGSEVAVVLQCERTSKLLLVGS
jgi:hypothetical protein